MAEHTTTEHASVSGNGHRPETSIEQPLIAVLCDPDIAAWLTTHMAILATIRTNPQLWSLARATYHKWGGNTYDLQKAVDFFRERHPREDEQLDTSFPFVDISPKAPPLPDRAFCEPPQLNTWLHAYIAHSQKWAPRAAPGFHAAVGLWVLSTIAARRIVAHMGSNDVFPTLFIALVAESTLWTKTTAASIGIRLIRRAGCGHLLSPDRTTPQYLLKLMSGIVPRDYGTASLDEQEEMRNAFSFAAQRGWFYEEWGGMLHQMRRIDSPHAELNKLLIVLEGGASTFETGTIQRGLEHIDNPYLALLGNATPHDLQSFMGEGDAWWHDGFWPRFVFVTPPRGLKPVRTPMPRENYEIPAHLIRELMDWHKRLGTATVSIDEVVEANGKRTGQWKGTVTTLPQHAMTLHDKTQDAYETYNDALLDLVENADVHPDLMPWYSRAHQKALRVAMLLASVQGESLITLPYWQEAQTIVEGWRTCLHAIAGETGEDGQSTRQTKRRTRLEGKIEYLLSASGGMSPRDLRRHIKAPSDELQSVLDGMLSIGTIITKTIGKRTLYLIFTEEMANA